MSEELRSTTGTPTRAILTAATRRLMAGELQAGIDELERIASRSDLTEDLLVEAESVRLLGAIALDNLSAPARWPRASSPAGPVRARPALRWP